LAYAVKYQRSVLGAILPIEQFAVDMSPHRLIIALDLYKRIYFQDYGLIFTFISNYFI